MTYTLKAILMTSLMIASFNSHEDITCEELMQNIIYEGVFFGGLGEHTLDSPFLKDVTAYIYNEELFVISTDSRERTTIYCDISKDDWVGFEKSCNCSYSKKFNEYIRKYECDCLIE